MSVKIIVISEETMQEETVISFDEKGLTIGSSFYETNSLKQFEIVGSSQSGGIGIVFNDVEIATVDCHGFHLSPDIRRTSIFEHLKILEDGVWVNELWVVVEWRNGKPYQYLKTYPDVWKYDFSLDAITLFSEQNANRKIKAIKKDITAFGLPDRTISCHPVSLIEKIA